ncbi:hypothetical protein [Candidatus Cyanaurora vandensis]|uniref:hypothetical protein n=1 Tax=Candidatus Cyanaurora vandensis TaxID=2714958 RepID=UPI00257E0A26|nr:hypothetical protein [Candidatus Cyanaurora vandensis]
MLEFSHHYCVEICAFLVPANVLTTGLVLWAVGRGSVWTQMLVRLGSVWALVMLLHVATWLWIGVVMVPTFVLLGLAGVCLGLNLWAALHRQSLKLGLRALLNRTKGRTKTVILSYRNH